MLVQINTDNNIEGHHRLEEYFTTQLQTSLKKYEEKITRLEVHLGDENSTKGGENDKRCSIEARIAGLKPIGVVNHANTIEKAVAGATDKIKSALEHTFGKLNAN
ncbi:HPF/RaiA family ribosome-associated protein [Flavobacterium arcticum]|uniref:HPF/RaiA family ribosome-associated protein n=1 Tax=Flavobacterium arcticum TaxID=1784713 RepID=A0A345HA76_9FLAO|nr:HPF/RaiA family ribosome-associated protein [Flavobacterium arcticum]AXG73486.1 HPF/RaiA family ribosome-associated protein [Flavobacterium arcticum]KAF2513275.1 HPF/RaiA family ribosome-associated protein [Flavobacterium arcticum]